MNPSIVYTTPLEEDVEVIPASSAQQRLWFRDQLKPDSAGCNVIFHINLRVALDVEVFKQSLDAIVQRHKVLSTAIREIEGQFMQTIVPSPTHPPLVVDLEHFSSGAEREDEILRLTVEEAQRSFDLSQGSLMRTFLLKLGRDDYLLLLSVHRAISDGWFIGLFCKELAELYEAVSDGRPSPLATLSMQYTDYILSQKEQLQADTLADQIAYWKKQLENASAVPLLPTDRTRPAVLTSRKAVQPFSLSKRLTDELKALSSREGVTLFTTLAAAFQALLSRYSGQDDILMCAPAAGRAQQESENLIDSFVNTLAIRTDLSGNPTFRELLERASGVIRESYTHQDVPFEYLVQELGLERNKAQSPLFQVMLAVEPPYPILPSGWTLTRMNLKADTSRFDLTLDLQDREGGLFGRCEYYTDLFDQASIVRVVGHWQMLLEGMVADPAQHIAALPLLTEAERHHILMEGNTAQAVFPQDQCIHQLIEAQVERTPEAVAVVFEDEQLTYSGLNARANRLAHYLSTLGVGPEVLVGLCVERSLDIVVGLLGILKAGGAYVPLDPYYPAERLAFLLKDSQVHVLLTQSHVADRLPEHHARLICLDTDWQEINRQSDANPVNKVEGKQLAYVIYTSGSTGQPKGVLIEHQAIAAHSRAITEAFELRAEDCVLQFSTFTFDTSLEQMLPTLSVGATLVVRGRDIWSPADLLHKIKKLGLTVINLPPAYLYQALQEWVRLPQQLLDHRLRLVSVGGDRLLPAALHLWRQMPLQSVRLLNAYGPTETTITATTFDITRHLDREQLLEKVPIGRPLPYRTTYILDGAGNPVPIGVVGELSIGGDLLARGYLNRPDLTAERFITDPFSQQPQARLYRTGDLARYLSDGTIEFLGRIDDQVKIRGLFIGLGEIEEALSQHPKIRETVVVAREGPSGEKYLVAYVVIGGGKSVESQELRSYLKQKLPEYMIPGAFVKLEKLPLMTNGKVDRHALPAPALTERTAEKAFVSPTLPLHILLVQIWEDLLGVRPIGIKDDFFDLGGHSLLAMRLFDRIAQTCGKKLPPSTLFAGATIEHLAAALMGEAKADARAPLLAVQVGGSKRPFFFLHGDWTGSAFYCFPLAGELGSDQPFYALEPYKFDGLPVPPTVEMMAAAHIESIRAVQPEGPYLLGGWCNGGLVAYEMARQLHSAGEKVALLVLMDPMYLGYRTRLRLLRVGIDYLGNLIGLSQEKRLNWFLRLLYVYGPLRSTGNILLRLCTRLGDVRNGSSQDSVRLIINDMLRYVRRQVKSGMKRFAGRFVHEPVAASQVETPHRDYGSKLEWIDMGYMPPSLYPGKTTFFWPGDEPWHSASWRQVAEAQETESYVLPGNQDSWKTKDVYALAKRLRTCLSEVQNVGVGH